MFERHLFIKKKSFMDVISSLKVEMLKRRKFTLSVHIVILLVVVGMFSSYSL